MVDFLLILPYNSTQTYTKEINMSAEKIIESLKEFCVKSSGDVLGQTWHGKSGTYHWNRGRDKPNGEVNGVVRKLAGIDAGGTQIWVVAGSFKIAENGTILRFTGLSKANWRELESTIVTPITVETITENV